MVYMDQIITHSTMTLKEKIQEIEQELDTNSINKQRKRYLISYLSDLEEYLIRHPDAINIPSSLELFCEFNPDSSECRIFDL